MGFARNNSCDLAASVSAEPCGAESQPIGSCSSSQFQLKGRSSTAPDVQQPSYSASHCHQTQHTHEFRLCHKSKAPPFLVHNEHIHHGYRVYFSKRLCLKSIFRLHNETGNIWTHFVAFWIFMLVLMPYTFFWVLTSQHDTVTDTLLFLQFLFAAKFCFLSSSVYHTFGCHSLRAFQRCELLDFTGIVTLICCSWVLLVNYLFYFRPVERAVYMVAIGGYGLLKVLFPHWGSSTHRTKTMLLTMLALFGAAPILHWAVVHGTTHRVVADILWRFPTCWSIYGLGFFFYATQVPERVWPGRFDYWLHSHQLWHLFVALGTAFFWDINVRLRDHVLAVLVESSEEAAYAYPGNLEDINAWLNPA